VFVTGEVSKPGPYPLIGSTTVLQMIATAGGLREYADGKHIVILRKENGRTTMNRFNYQDALKSRGLRSNIELKPGDTIVVP
jgi:polysaccharide export outer membrane protein